MRWLGQAKVGKTAGRKAVLGKTAGRKAVLGKTAGKKAVLGKTAGRKAVSLSRWLTHWNKLKYCNYKHKRNAKNTVFSVR